MKTFLKLTLTLLLFIAVSCDPNDTIEPIPPSDGDTIEAEVGGPDQPNQVYIDLSTGLSTVSPRTKWDLAFATGSEFAVALNYSAFMSARPTDKTVLTEVTADLVTDDYKAEMATENFCNIDWIDDPSGNLSLGAIGSISSTDNDNVVFVIDRGYVENGQTPMDRGSVKARVIREGENYSISYGDIDDSSFTTLTIPKDPNYNFIFFSFDNGIVNVEPEKTNWDISMTTSTLPAEFGPGVYVSYNYKDISLSNHNNVKISSVEVTDIINYNDFTLAEANALILENNRMGIGTSWRTLVSREAGYILNSDIFYVIEDPSGNLYKLKFTRMFCISGDCAGERGYPEFTYELMK